MSEQLASEDPAEAIVPTQTKRGAGYCYRRGRSGKKMILIPYRCWRGNCWL